MLTDAEVSKRRDRIYRAIEEDDRSLAQIAKQARCSGEYLRCLIDPGRTFPRHKLTTVERIEKALGIKSK